jgi:hypothetical protein
MLSQRADGFCDSATQHIYGSPTRRPARSGMTVEAAIKKTCVFAQYFPTKLACRYNMRT